MLCCLSLFELIRPWVFCCCCFLRILLLSLSIYIFAALLAVALCRHFLRSFPLDSSVSSVFKNSLISSSHPFFGLPTGLLVLTLLSRPGFHSDIFLTSVHQGELPFSSPFSTSSFSVFQSCTESLLSSFFFCFSCASLNVFNPFFFLNFHFVSFF